MHRLLPWLIRGISICTSDSGVDVKTGARTVDADSTSTPRTLQFWVRMSRSGDLRVCIIRGHDHSKFARDCEVILIFPSDLLHALRQRRLPTSPAAAAASPDQRDPLRLKLNNGTRYGAIHSCTYRQLYRTTETFNRPRVRLQPPKKTSNTNTLTTVAIV